MKYFRAITHRPCEHCKFDTLMHDNGKDTVYCPKCGKEYIIKGIENPIAVLEPFYLLDGKVVAGCEY
jgi:PHP family Zn ribbon phosphoesterase